MKMIQRKTDDTVNNLIQDPLREAQTFLQNNSYFTIQIVELRNTNQSKTFLISTTNLLRNEEQKFILKIFSPKYQFNSAKAVQEEFSTLEKFYKTLQHANLHQIITCPLPIAIFESSQAYLMSYVHGQSLESAWKQSDINSSEIAPKLITGLSVFYETMNTIYADFHPGNIIIGPHKQIGFIDPTIPEPFFHSFSVLQHYPYCVDLGYWLNLVSVTSAKLLYTFNHKVCIRRWNFTRSLLAAAVSNIAFHQQESFLFETRQVALAHLRYLTQTKIFKGYFHYLISKQIATYLTEPGQLKNQVYTDVIKAS